MKFILAVIAFCSWWYAVACLKSRHLGTEGAAVGLLVACAVTLAVCCAMLEMVSK